MPPANNTLSVYLGKELADKIAAAEEVDPEFRATEFCKRKLTELINGSSDDRPAVPAEQFEYEVTSQDTLNSVTAYLNDVVQPQGGYPISVAPNITGGYVVTVAWPQQ